MLKELIRAIYEIAKAIKGDDGNGGGENSNDNGLYGADGIIVVINPNKQGIVSKVFLSQKELFDDFKINFVQYSNNGDGRRIYFLYTENNIDKLLKPTQGIIGKTYQVLDEQFQFSTNFLNEYNLQNYELIPIQDYDSIPSQGNFTESDVQQIVEKLGNNVYVFSAEPVQ